MFASPSHPVAAPVDLKAGAVSKVLNLAEAAFVRCLRAHLCNVIHHKVRASHTCRLCGSAGVFSSDGNRLSAASLA